MSPTRLQREVQSDFGAGAQPDVARHLIDGRGIFDLINGLLDDDGSAYRRGGAKDWTDNSAPDSAPTTWLWEGYLNGRKCGLVANEDHFYTRDGDQLLQFTLAEGLSGPVTAVEIEGMLFIGGGFIYAGAREEASQYNSTVGVTVDSATITAASGFTANVEAGMLFQVGNERVYVVEEVASDTSLTLRGDYEGSTNASASGKFFPIYSMSASDPYRISEGYAVAGGKLIAYDEDVVYMAGLDLTTGISKPHEWDEFDYHRFSEAVKVIAVTSIEDVAVAFTTGGIQTIAGLAYNLVDDLGNPQHVIQNVSKDVIAWGNGAGISAWKGGLIIPSRDAIWLMDFNSRPVELSHPIESLYRRYVELGYQPGKAAIFRQHYFLPIYDSATSECIDLLCCRLDKPIEVRQRTTYPWTRLAGLGAKVSGLQTIDEGLDDDTSHLIAATTRFTGLTELDTFFDPQPENRADPASLNGGVISSALWHQMELVTRDYLTGGLGRNRLRRVELHYDLRGEVGSDEEPFVNLYISEGKIGEGATLWGNFLWGVGLWTGEGEFRLVRGQAPVNDGTIPYTWNEFESNFIRFVRLQLRSSGSASKLVIRHIGITVAPSQSVRHA